jgi:hypothetical protein
MRPLDETQQSATLKAGYCAYNLSEQGVHFPLMALVFVYQGGEKAKGSVLSPLHPTYSRSGSQGRRCPWL